MSGSENTAWLRLSAAGRSFRREGSEAGAGEGSPVTSSVAGEAIASVSLCRLRSRAQDVGVCGVRCMPRHLCVEARAELRSRSQLVRFEPRAGLCQSSITARGRRLCRSGPTRGNAAARARSCQARSRASRGGRRGRSCCADDSVGRTWPRSGRARRARGDVCRAPARGRGGAACLARPPLESLRPCGHGRGRRREMLRVRRTRQQRSAPRLEVSDWWLSMRWATYRDATTSCSRC